jgi:hypothetical protein
MNISTIYGKSLDEIRVLIEYAEKTDTMRLLTEISMLRGQLYRFQGYVANYDKMIRDLEDLRLRQQAGR